jgi:hypothetical protein
MLVGEHEGKPTSVSDMTSRVGSQQRGLPSTGWWLHGGVAAFRDGRGRAMVGEDSDVVLWLGEEERG